MEPPKPKTTAVKSTTKKDFEDFMDKQTKMNENILVQLHVIGKMTEDKCGCVSISPGGSDIAHGRSKGRGELRRGKQPVVRDINIHSSSSPHTEAKCHSSANDVKSTNKNVQ